MITEQLWEWQAPHGLGPDETVYLFTSEPLKSLATKMHASCLGGSAKGYMDSLLIPPKYRQEPIWGDFSFNRAPA